MKYTIEKFSDGVVFSYRVYHRKETSFRSYVAKIVGPHPNYYLDRMFDYRGHLTNSRFDTYRYWLNEGIYEYVVKRFQGDQVIQKERMWIVVAGNEVYSYDEDEMNYQYVLYTQFLLSGALRRREAAVA